MFVSSFNFNIVCTSAGFHFFPQTIFTNFNTQLTDCTSRECYALDSYRTTEERNYSTICSNLLASRLRIRIFTFSFLYFWEIPCLGNNIQHTVSMVKDTDFSNVHILSTIHGYKKI